jgi:hypothetical protein
VEQSRASNATLRMNQKEEPTAAQLERFDTATDPVVPLMMLWSNSGLHHTRAVTAISSDHPAANVRADDLNESDHPDLVKALDSIGEPITESTMSHLIKKFTKDWNREARLYGCGCCGVAAFNTEDEPFHEFPIKKLEYLEMEEQALQQYELYGKYKNVCSVYADVSSQKKYHLHPELVDSSSSTTFICDNCHRVMKTTKKAPPMSVKNVDFLVLARHPGLQPLSDIERMVLQSVRVYGLQYLIRSSTVDARKFSGHCISFIQDNMATLSAHFASWGEVLDDVVKNIQVVFVGNREDYESWKGKRAKIFQVSSSKILEYYQALSVLFSAEVCGRKESPWSKMTSLTEEGLIGVFHRLESLDKEIFEKTINCESEELLDEILKVGSSVASANEADCKGNFIYNHNTKKLIMFTHSLI